MSLWYNFPLPCAHTGVWLFQDISYCRAALWRPYNDNKSLIWAVAASSPPQEGSSLSPFSEYNFFCLLFFLLCHPAFIYESVTSGSVAKWSWNIYFHFHFTFIFLCHLQLFCRWAKHTIWCLCKQNSSIDCWYNRPLLLVTLQTHYIRLNSVTCTAHIGMIRARGGQLI